MGEYIVLKQAVEAELAMTEDGAAVMTDPEFEYIILEITAGIGDLSQALVTSSESLAIVTRDRLNGVPGDPEWRDKLDELRKGQPP